MITTASVHIDGDTGSVDMRCSARRDAGSITISDGRGGEVVLYVNADTAAKLAAASLEVMNAIDISSKLHDRHGGLVISSESPCDLCGAACYTRADGSRTCDDSEACSARAGGES